MDTPKSAILWYALPQIKRLEGRVHPRKVKDRCLQEQRNDFSQWCSHYSFIKA